MCFELYAPTAHVPIGTLLSVGDGKCWCHSVWEPQHMNRAEKVGGRWTSLNASMRSNMGCRDIDGLGVVKPNSVMDQRFDDGSEGSKGRHCHAGRKRKVEWYEGYCWKVDTTLIVAQTYAPTTSNRAKGYLDSVGRKIQEKLNMCGWQRSGACRWVNREQGNSCRESGAGRSWTSHPSRVRRADGAGSSATAQLRLMSQNFPCRSDYCANMVGS